MCPKHNWDRVTRKVQGIYSKRGALSNIVMAQQKIHQSCRFSHHIKLYRKSFKKKGKWEHITVLIPPKHSCSFLLTFYINDKFTVCCPTSDPIKVIGPALLHAEKEGEGPWEKKKESRKQNQEPVRMLLQKYKISTCTLFWGENFLWEGVSATLFRRQNTGSFR